MRITDDILYVGVNDHNIDLFEGHYIVPNGMAYNSYVINDEKIAVMDTVDVAFGDEWLKNIADVLNGATPDYLIVQHMEPDHSANIQKFLEVYPNTKVVGNAKTFTMIGNFFRDLKLADENKLEVKNKDTLTLGKHELTFVFAPMVHWPEVMVTYDSKDKVLFSADGFGKFGALDVEEDWDCEARRYYIGIVGKYGAQVQNLLKVAATLDIQIICPLHGPVLTENLEHYIGQYNTWSSYGTESEGVMIAYTSVYGNTKKAVELLAEKLKEKGHMLQTYNPNDIAEFQIMLQSTGKWFTDNDGNADFVNNDALKECYDVFKKLNESDFCQVVSDWTGFAGAINNGDVACVMRGSWITSTIMAGEDQSGKWKMAPIPKMSTEGATHYSNQGGSSWFVLKNSKNAEAAAKFLGKTFGGSVEMYDSLMKSNNIIGTYLPASDCEAVEAASDFFSGQQINKTLVEWEAQIPSVNTGAFSAEAQSALLAVTPNILNGSDLDTELAAAEEQFNQTIQ